MAPILPAPSPPAAAQRPLPPQAIEPGRLRLIERRALREAPRLDLHGLDQGRARQALEGFLARAFQDGERACLVITGKGAFGQGVLRRRVPEWLAEASLRPMIAGVSTAHRRHGGEGALYIALKRRTG